MGLVFQGTGSYAIGLMLLSGVAFDALVFAALRVARRPDATPEPHGSAT